MCFSISASMSIPYKSSITNIMEVAVCATSSSSLTMARTTSSSGLISCSPDKPRNLPMAWASSPTSSVIFNIVDSSVGVNLPNLGSEIVFRSKQLVSQSVTHLILKMSQWHQQRQIANARRAKDHVPPTPLDTYQQQAALNP